MKVYVMDSFSDRIFGGNQAGVVLADKALEPYSSSQLSSGRIPRVLGGAMSIQTSGAWWSRSGRICSCRGSTWSVPPGS